MKKIGVSILIIILFLSLTLVIAAENDTNNTASTTPTTTQQQNLSKIEKAFECLEEQVEGNCDSLSIPEISFTILATPKNSIMEECKDSLISKRSSQGDCWPSGNCNIKDTAIAVLAMDHLGQNTDDAEEWLLNQNRTATDLIWYLEQDSDEPSQCKISYSGNDYTIDVADNKKINTNAGSCLSLAQSNFWLQVAQNCYNTEFAVSCDKEFIATFLYRYQNSPTLFILSDTASQPSYGTVNLKINTKCFGASSCDYESSLWATIALIQKNHDVDNFLPYLIALAEANQRYLPNSFLYMATSYEDYGNKLIQDQRLGNYWQADLTPYNKFYDTSLALLALRNSQAEQVVKSKDWMLFQQKEDGCWKNSNPETIRDTAIALWALTGRSYGSTGTGGETTYCSEANFFCIATADCPENQQLGNYYCSGLGNTCCQTENLKTCSEYLGKVCSSDELCTGNTKKSSDQDNCCLGDCQTKTTETECESMRYICRSECGDNQEEVSHSCDSGDVCCRTSTTPEPSSLLWLWILLIILIIIIVLLIIFRHRVKLAYFKMKNKFKKDKGPKGLSGPFSPGPPGAFPPRPGFPPIRRMPMRRGPARPVQRPQPQSRDKSMDETFKKLQEMSK